jgi:hypothetical protein
MLFTIRSLFLLSILCRIFLSDKEIFWEKVLSVIGMALASDGHHILELTYWYVLMSFTTNFTRPQVAIWGKILCVYSEKWFYV